MRAYRYFDGFQHRPRMAPPGQLRDQYLARVLRGLSRMLGAPGYHGAALLPALRQASGDWAIIREIPASDFELTVPVRTSPYVETCPDTLVLRHPDARLSLTLDTAELVLAARRR